MPNKDNTFNVGDRVTSLGRVGTIVETVQLCYYRIKWDDLPYQSYFTGQKLHPAPDTTRKQKLARIRMHNGAIHIFRFDSMQPTFSGEGLLFKGPYVPFDYMHIDGIAHIHVLTVPQ
jgi:hypothetical protein